ncbi:hypothetical protein ACJX0J_019132 [Zea mays]
MSLIWDTTKYDLLVTCIIQGHIDVSMAIQRWFLVRLCFDQMSLSGISVEKDKDAIRDSHIMNTNKSLCHKVVKLFCTIKKTWFYLFLKVYNEVSILRSKEVHSLVIVVLPNFFRLYMGKNTCFLKVSELYFFSSIEGVEVVVHNMPFFHGFELTLHASLRYRQIRTLLNILWTEISHKKRILLTTYADPHNN